MCVQCYEGQREPNTSDGDAIVSCSGYCGKGQCYDCVDNQMTLPKFRVCLDCKRGACGIFPCSAWGNIIVCDSCGKTVCESCEGQHNYFVACQWCTTCCSCYERNDPGQESLQCKVCQVGICGACRAFQHSFSLQISHSCQKCDRSTCQNCISGCTACKAMLCKECQSGNEISCCVACGANGLCKKCREEGIGAHCATCSRFFCSNCELKPERRVNFHEDVSCFSCHKSPGCSFCAANFVECKHCRLRGCPEHVPVEIKCRRYQRCSTVLRFCTDACAKIARCNVCHQAACGGCQAALAPTKLSSCDACKMTFCKRCQEEKKERKRVVASHILNCDLCSKSVCEHCWFAMPRHQIVPDSEVQNCSKCSKLECAQCRGKGSKLCMLCADAELQGITALRKANGKGSFGLRSMSVPAKGFGKGDEGGRRYGKGVAIQYVDPLSIEFSQSGINPIRFSDGRRVNDLIEALRAGATQPEDVPRMLVHERRVGTRVTHDNRRLYCFQKAQNIQAVPVQITDRPVPTWKYSSVGRTVELQCRRHGIVYGRWTCPHRSHSTQGGGGFCAVTLED